MNMQYKISFLSIIQTKNKNAIKKSKQKKIILTACKDLHRENQNTDLRWILLLYLTFFWSQSDIVSIKELALVLEIISQCDFKHIMMMLLMRTITSDLNVLTYIITIIRLDMIQVIMSVSIFKTDVILYILLQKTYIISKIPRHEQKL